MPTKTPHGFNFLEQFIDPSDILLFVGLRHLLSEFLYIAIGLSFDFVAADDCRDLLCVTLAHPGVLSLYVRRQGGDQQNSDNELSVHLERPIYCASGSRDFRTA